MTPPWLRSPGAAYSRVRRSLFEWLNPGAPWLAPRAVEILDGALRPTMIGLEWGSGRSTIWLGRRLRSLTSVEHNATWVEKVRTRIEATGLTNIDYRFVPEPMDPEQSGDRYWDANPYVTVVDDFEDASLDFVLVDGLYRQNCVARVLPKVAVGGLLVVDQSHHVPRLEDWRVPPDWEIVYHSPLPYFDTTIWRRPG